MCPPAAVARSVGVASAIRMSMMNAMRRDPLNRAAFERQRSTGDQEVFDCLRNLIRAVCDQAVIAHADAKHAGNPIKYYSSDERRPAPEKESPDRQQVTNDKKNCRTPIESLLRRSRFFTRCLHVQMFPNPTAAAERNSSAPAIALIFFNSVRWKPKKVAIWTIWFRLTKSAGLAQNFCIPGLNSRQLMPFGILIASRQSPAGV